MRILHLLQWNISSIIKELPLIRKQGFDCIQISPVQGTKEDNKEFWVLYQPTNFKIGNSQIGTKEELIKLCSKAKEYDLKIIVDIVLRHTANDNYNCLIPNDNIDLELKQKEFFIEKRNIQNQNDRWESTHLCMNLPMLNYWNHDLQKIYIRFLNELKECGVDGFRIDMAKHFCLPEENCDFYTNVIFPFNNLIIYGEVIQANKDIVDKYSNYMLVATDSFGNNKDKLIAWIESYDDHLTWGCTKKLTSEMINKEYSNLCSIYKNTLYYARPFCNAWKDEMIKTANKK